MKTVTLRTLVREPRKVKKLTRAGNSVQVTDNGKPLWILQPANAIDEDEERRIKEIDALLDKVHCGPKSKFNTAKLLLESRR
jgi:hypothetical protein